MVTNSPSLTASLPNGYAVTVGTANQLGVPANPARGGLLFYNNSASATVSFCPASLTTVPSGAPPAIAGQTSNFTGITGPVQGVAGTNAPGSVTLLAGGVFTIDNLNCGGAWNAVSSVPGGALTVLEF